MIGTIRKHSKWLWIVIIILTVISFIYWGAAPSQPGGSGQTNGDFGSINGKKITQQQYASAVNGYKLFYLFHYGSWPDQKAGVTAAEEERETYARLLLLQKASDLGIQASLDAAAVEANQMLRSLGRKGQTITMDEFVDQVLKPEGLTATDFENFARQDVIIQQLVGSVGLSGALITPQEAAALYEREHQELAAQIVFFPAENYLPAVKVTPGALGTFYTNYLAEYRLPDRVQISYVFFNVTNFLAQSQAGWEKTNFNAQIDSIYMQEGAEAFPEAKTPDGAKKMIREILIRNRALADAREQANAFATTVFALTNGAEDLAVVAKQNGLTVRTTAPFDAESGPKEFAATAEFAKTAFALTPDEPFANPITTTNGVYVIALARQLPSEIQPFADIRAQVAQDFKMQQALALAREAGTNFSLRLTVAMAAGKSFAAVCAADHVQPETLPPFSISTRELPALGDRAELDQVKQAAFTTLPGHASNFQESADGGFILFVKSQLPVDQSVMAAGLPQFTEQLRRTRENEAFQEWLNQTFSHWLQSEAGEQLRKKIMGTDQ